MHSNLGSEDIQYSNDARSGAQILNRCHNLGTILDQGEVVESSIQPLPAIKLNLGTSRLRRIIRHPILITMKPLIRSGLLFGVTGRHLYRTTLTRAECEVPNDDPRNNAESRRLRAALVPQDSVRSND